MFDDFFMFPCSLYDFNLTLYDVISLCLRFLGVFLRFCLCRFLLFASDFYDFYKNITKKQAVSAVSIDISLSLSHHLFIKKSSKCSSDFHMIQKMRKHYGEKNKT